MPAAEAGVKIYTKFNSFNSSVKSRSASKGRVYKLLLNMSQIGSTV